MVQNVIVFCGDTLECQAASKSVLILQHVVDANAQLARPLPCPGWPLGSF